MNAHRILHEANLTEPQEMRLVPVWLLERVEQSLGSFTSDEGWAQSDMDTMDSVSAILAQISAHDIYRASCKENVMNGQHITPIYLKELRDTKTQLMDRDQIESVQKKILDANKAGKRHLIIPIPADNAWESTIAFFRSNGFYVSAYGRDGLNDYDAGGNLVHLFEFGW